MACRMERSSLVGGRIGTEHETREDGIDVLADDLVVVQVEVGEPPMELRHDAR